jgi:hypothetical protein
MLSGDGWASVTTRTKPEQWALDDDVAIEIQRRPDLYFVHAAVLELGAGVHAGRRISTGKSTTAWALLHHGCGYLAMNSAPSTSTHLPCSRICARCA